MSHVLSAPPPYKNRRRSQNHPDIVRGTACSVGPVTGKNLHYFVLARKFEFLQPFLLELFVWGEIDLLLKSGD
jgi:hypothetical protein